jgi:hypothetical protein
MKTVSVRIVAKAAFIYLEGYYLVVKSPDGNEATWFCFSRDTDSIDVRLIKRYFNTLINKGYQLEYDKPVWHEVSVPKSFAHHLVLRRKWKFINPLLSVHHVTLPQTGPVTLSEKDERVLSPILKNGQERSTKSGAFDMYYTHIILDAVTINERLGVILSDHHEWGDMHGYGCTGIGMTSILRAVVNGVVYSKSAAYRECSDPQKDREYEYMGNRIIRANVEKDGQSVGVLTNEGWHTLKRG